MLQATFLISEWWMAQARDFIKIIGELKNGRYNLIVCEIIDKLSAYHMLERSFKRL